MRRLHGLQALVHDIVDATTHLVEEGRSSVGRNLLRAAEGTPAESPVATVEHVHAMTTAGVLAAIRLTNRIVELAAGLAWSGVPQGGEPEAVPLRSDIVGSPVWAADALIGALNGLAGDHLRERGNVLDMGMSLRRVGEATGRVLILVHGLSATEWSWVLNADARLGAPGAHYGVGVEDLGFSTLLARYNTGVPIARNGEALARVLGERLSRWPVPVERVVVLGHSMGGLVGRAALGEADASGWRASVTDLITLASPFEGAPLARFAESAGAALRAVDLPASKVLARIVGARSAGIRDLAAPWMDEPTPEPLRGLREHHFVATLASEPDGGLARMFGDGLVMPASAAMAGADPRRGGLEGAGVDGRRVRVFPGRNHVEIQVDREVLAALREVLEERS